MASVNAPRGLQLAKKNGDGSNSTGIRTIDLNVKPCCGFCINTFRRFYR